MIDHMPHIHPIYHIRFIEPSQSDWIGYQAASIEEAIGSVLERNTSKCLSTRVGDETAFFAVVEVEDHGQFIGRHFYAGIGRKGGVSRKMPNERASLEEIEQELCLEPGELGEDDWQGEESVEQAWDRQMGRNK